MKKFLALALTAIIALSFAACSDDDDYIPVDPTYESLILSPTQVMAGDTVYAKVPFKDKGKYWYYYNDNTGYIISGPELYRFTKLVIPGSDEPNFTIVAPENPGIYTVKFNAHVSHYAGKGTLYGESNTVEATFEVIAPEEEEE